MRLELREVSKTYGGAAAVDRLSLTVAAGRIGCLLGPSGSGKTTVLRAIAGFERPDAGEILAGGERLSGPGFWVPPERRRAVVTRELFIALGIMVFFLFFGKSLMAFLALDIISLSVGCGKTVCISSASVVSSVRATA